MAEYTMNQQVQRRWGLYSNRNIRIQARPFTDRIFSSRNVDAATQVALKWLPFPVVNHVVRTAPVQKALLVGNPFPKTLTDFAGDSASSSTSNLDQELKWYVAVFARYSERLRACLQMAARVECCILIGDIALARTLSDQIQRDHGVSLWWIKQKLLIDELTYGLRGNRQCLTHLSQAADNLSRLYLQFFSKQCEENVSYEEYMAAVGDFISRADIARSENLAKYLQFRLGLHVQPPLDFLHNVLHYEECHPVLDRFFVWCSTLRYVLEHRSLHPEDELSKAIKLVAHLIDWGDLNFVEGIVDPSAIPANELFAESYSLIHHYTSGDYLKAEAMSASLLQRYPKSLEFYELLVKSAVHSGHATAEVFASGSMASVILTSVDAVLRRSDQTQDALRCLQRMSCRLLPNSLAVSIDAFVRQHSSDEVPLRIDRRTALAGTIPTPRVLSNTVNAREAFRLFESLKGLFPGNAAVGLFADDSAGISDGFRDTMYRGLPLGRVLRHQAFVQERRKNYGQALDAYLQMSRIVSDRSVHATDAQAGAIRCLIELERIADAVRLLADACVHRPHVVSRTMLVRVISLYDHQKPHCGAGNIAWPIVYATAERIGAIGQSYDFLHDMLDDFLEKQGCRRPSELLIKASSFHQSELVHFLRAVCVPAVLRCSIWYDCESDIEEERIGLCRWLIEHDSDASSRYVDEIADLSRSAAIRDIVHEVDRSRVFVDTYGIERVLPQIARERALRCASLVLLNDEKLRRCLDLIGISLQALKTRPLVFVDEGLVLFKELFIELKESFVGSTEYGLNANLSQRIRHGALAGEIRARFEDFHLVTHLDESGRYSRPTYWEMRVGEEWVEGLQDPFQAFSSEIDRIIGKVRNEWIQIRLPVALSGGLFDYEVSEDEMMEYYAALPVDRDQDSAERVDAVIQHIIDSLWHRTDMNLERVRNAIRNELRDELFGELQCLEDRLRASLPYSQISEILFAIANCRVALGTGLETISDWFRIHAKQRVPDCKFAHLADAVVRVVARFSRPSLLECEPVVSPGLVCPGEAFRGIWDILFILLDNAAKHSGLPRVDPIVRIDTRGDACQIIVDNEFGPDVSIERLKAIAEQLSQPDHSVWYLRGVTREGGSGHQKLHKILRYDLRSRTYSIRALVSESRRFCVEVSIVLQGTTDEGIGG